MLKEEKLLVGLAEAGRLNRGFVAREFRFRRNIPSVVEIASSWRICEHNVVEFMLVQVKTTNNSA